MFHEENLRQNKKLHISRPTPPKNQKKHCKERTKLIFGRSVVDFALVFEGALPIYISICIHMYTEKHWKFIQKPT